jgi:hypothetical protein
MTNREKIMYLSKEKSEQIAAAFDAFGLWSNEHGLHEKNNAYALKRQAEAVLVLVSCGIPHNLEDWAKDLLSNDRYINATYEEVA